MIRGARQLLTLRGPQGPRRGADLSELALIPDGALLIENGLIEEAGPSRRVENLARARGAIEINAGGRVVMPGFVDSHTHLVFPPPSSPDAELERALKTVRVTTAKRLAARSRHHLQAMARYGTTTVEAKTGCGAEGRAEIKLLRVLASLKRDPVDVVATLLVRHPRGTAAPERSAQAIAEWYIRELLPLVKDRKLAAFVDVAWGEDGETQKSQEWFLRNASELGFGCRVHADHAANGRALGVAAGQHVIGVDHLEHATRAETALLAGSRTLATLLPYFALQSRSGGALARALIDAGVAVALASDFNPVQAPHPNMQAAVALACLYMGMRPAEAISAATINGAHALGRGGAVGSLEPGKSADLLILNISDYREMAQHFGTNLVHLTMKRGEFIYQEGKVALRPVEELHPLC